MKTVGSVIASNMVPKIAKLGKLPIACLKYKAMFSAISSAALTSYFHVLVVTSGKYCLTTEDGRG